MNITRTYNDPNNTIILNFNDSELKHFHLPPIIKNENISFNCSVAKYRNAIHIEHKGNGNHCLRINWSRIIMSAPVENFTVQIKYGTNIRITAQVQIKYPFKPINLKCELSVKIGRWGTDPQCSVNIRPDFSHVESWKYKDRQVCLIFAGQKEDIFYPAFGQAKYIFSASKGISIPLKCKFPNEIIKEQKQIFINFSLDQQSISLPFKFAQTQVSSESFLVEVNKISDYYEYGSSDKKVFKVSVKPQSRFVSVDSLKISFKNYDIPLYFKEIEGYYYIFICANKIKWLTSDTCYNFDILVNNICFSKEIHISPQESKVPNHIQLKPGKSPDVLLLPSNSIELTQGNTCKIGLEINNQSTAPITITKVSHFCSENCDINISLNKNVIIQPGSRKQVNVELHSEKSGTKKIEFKVKTKETESARCLLNANIKEKEDSQIMVSYTPDNNFDIVVQKKYLSPMKCGLITISKIIKSQNVKPFIKDDFKILSEDFEIQFLQHENDEWQYETRLKVNAFSDLENIPYNDQNGLFYLLAWEYHKQKGVINIPIKDASLYLCDINNKDSILFPFNNNDRKVIIGDIKISEPNEKDILLDNNQRLSIDKPFYFSEEGLEQNEIEIRNKKNIQIGIDVNKIDGISSETLNINEILSLDLNITCKGEILNRKFKTKKIQLIPVNESAKRNVFFEDSEGNEIRIFLKETNNAIVNIEEQAEDVIAVKLGDIKIRNLSKIPYKENAVRCKIKQLSGICGSVDFLHQDSLSLIENDIIIYNGDTDFNIPIIIDYIRWKESSSSEKLIIKLELETTKEDENKELIVKTSTYILNLELVHQFIDDVFSLDLGTTGIVVAKERDGMQEIIKLEDSDNPIEKDEEIISSHTMLIAKESTKHEQSEFILSPSEDEYYGHYEQTQKIRFRLVPSKFIIGQERIPFLGEFYDNKDLNKNTRLFGSTESIVDLSINSDKEKNRSIISEVVASLYKNIFSKFNQEVSQIKKLVITYPNTYTIENLESIGMILKEELHLNLNGQITFVPESDAVAAYYFDQIIMHKGGFLNNEGLPKDEENVIIYDMGAGTLDLSLISFRQTNGSITASIINKIGIPLAGNYLDYLICRALIDSGVMNDSFISEKPSTIKEISIGIKQSFNPKEKIKEQEPQWFKENHDYLTIGEETYSNIFDEAIKQFQETCSSTVLELLIPKGTKVDTIVFSGRASKFTSLRESVKSSLKKLMGGVEPVEDTLLPTTNCGDYLKTCVAIGALKYQSFFNNNNNFRIENKNLYSKIALVYYGKSEILKYDVKVKFLIDPQTEQWDDAELINGTWCKEFYANEKISDQLPGKHIYYIQTCLDESRLKELFKKVYLNDISKDDDLNWAFVNILFKLRITDAKPFDVSLKISKENKIIQRKIGSKLLLDTKLLENVEDNILYKRSMWPFITSLK